MTNLSQKIEAVIEKSIDGDFGNKDDLSSALREFALEVVGEVREKLEDQPKSESVMPQDERGYGIAYDEVWSVLKSLKDSLTP